MGNRPRIRRIHAFIGSPYDSAFMRWFIRCTWAVMGLILLLAVSVRLSAEDRPIAKLNNSVFETSATKVYDFVDPVTKRRFLVVYTNEGGVAMIEATPPPAAPTPVVQLAPRRAAPPPAPDTASMWEVSRTYNFTQKMADAGWTITKWETVGSREFAHIRRRNPHWVEPTDVEKIKE